MSSNVYTSISELYNVDQEIVTKVRLLARKQKLISDLSDKIDFFSQEVDTISERIKIINHQIRECDLESRSLDERLLKDRRDLRNSVDIKVATKLEHEIKRLEFKQSQLDEQLIDLWDRKASAETELRFSQVTLKEKKVEIEEKAKAIQSDIDHIHSRVDEQKRMQQRLIVQLNSWQAPYQSVKQHVEDPIALARRGVCNACDMVLPKSDQLRLLKHAILQCPGCFRLLFTTDLQ